MIATLKQTACLARGASVLTLSALLVGTGLAIPAQAAEDVPFTPTVDLSVSPVTPVSSDATVKVKVGAVEGDEWTDVDGEKALVTVRVDVYEHEEEPPTYAAANAKKDSKKADDEKVEAAALTPDGSDPVSSETFVADEGAKEYTFTPYDVTYVEGVKYVFVASVLVEDGSNPEYIEEDVSTEYGADGTHTDYLFAPSVTYTPNAKTVEQGAKVTTTFEGLNFDGKTLEVTSKIFGPYESVEDAYTGTNKTVGTLVTTFDGTSEATTEPVVLNEKGLYFWQHAIYIGDNIVPVYMTRWDPESENAGIFVEVTEPANTTPTPNPTPTPVPVGPKPPTGPGVVPVPVPVEDPAPVTPSPTGPRTGAGNGTGPVTGSPVTAPVTSPDVSAPNYSTELNDCAEAKAAGYENIEQGSALYTENLDPDKDGTACETDGSDSAVVIDGGFAQASSATPTNVGAFSLILGALAFGLVRLHKKA